MIQTLPKKLLPFFWHFIKKQPLAFLILFIAPCAVTFESAVIPYAMKNIIDAMSSYTGDKMEILTQIAPYLWLGGVAWCVMASIFRLQHWLQAYVLPKFQQQIRMEATSYVMEHSHRYFANQLSGRLSNKISDLVSGMDKIRMITCWNFVSTSSVVLVALFMLATVQPIFSYILAVWIVITLSAIIYIAQKVNDASAENADDKTVLSGIIVDAIANIVSVKLFARKKHEREYLQKYQDVERNSNKKLMMRTNLLCFVMDGSATIMMFVVFYYAIHGWMADSITTGDFILLFYISWSVMFHMWFMSQALIEFFREVGVSKQALEVITEPHEVVDAADAKPLAITHGRIEFDNVTFNYKEGSNVFANKNVIIEAGSKVGLVGFSGSGKTTFVNLILRFFDIDAGRILIDGQDIAKVMQDSLRAGVAMIPQDPALFHRSLMENIRYGNVDASDEEVIAASKQAHCHEFIEKLPDGYNSLVGERGIKLSGGQRQRIAIARAMLKNAPILILDEATSALDSVTEKLIQEGLETLMKDCTTIVIAHRLSTLSEMDRILVFDKGHIIEDGTHGELLKIGGHYAKMWHMQAGGFLPEVEDEKS